ADDGTSGTVPLADWPDGRRLQIDGEAVGPGAVLVYRIDELSRSLHALLEAHGAQSKHGAVIRSVTEPFDTFSPIGASLCRLLASLAEPEKSTISERTCLAWNREA